MNLSELLNQITALQKDSETLEEIRTITGSTKEEVVEYVKALQKNEIPANINNIKRKIDRLDEYIDGAEQEYLEAYDDCQNAISSLENLSYDLDYISDCRTSIEALRETLEETEDEPEETEDEPIKNDTEVAQDRLAQENQDKTIFSDDDKNSLIDVISDSNSQQ